MESKHVEIVSNKMVNDMTLIIVSNMHLSKNVTNFINRLFVIFI